MIKTRRLLAATLIAGVTVLSTAANASLVLTSGNVGSTDQNVVFQHVTYGTDSLTTDTNSSPANRVTFTSNETLTGAESSGQARISDAGNDGFNLLTWFMANTSLGFATNVFNINDLTATLADITVVTNLQTKTYEDVVIKLNGNNFFTLEAGGGEIIKSVSILALNGGLFEDVRQERLGGISGAVPEASTWAMMILGFAGVGFLAYRRRGQGQALRLV
jgi:hypothetical protein